MIKHIFYTTVTGRGKFDGFRGQEWYDYRLEIFKNYTLKSLLSQTDKDFTLWMSFRPQEIDNPTTEKIEKAIREAGINYVLTFDGMIMYDDRSDRNSNLIERTANSLLLLEPIEEDYVYETHFDSDDMVSKNFVKLVKSYPFKERGALYMKDGYVLNTDGRVAEWHNPTSQQNYTIMYPRKIYLDPFDRYKYQNGLHTHEEIPSKFNAEELPKGMYCSVIHGKNISTIWGHPFMGKEVDKSILKEFGL